MKIDKINISTNVCTYSANNIYENFNTYRKLKEILYYFYFDELYKGVKPVIFVETKFNDIVPYSFNYNEANEHGVDVVLLKPLDTFDNTSYVYVFNDKEEAMNTFLQKKKEYLNACKSILFDEYNKLSIEKSVKAYEERERLAAEIEQKVNEIMDIYDIQLERVNVKINLINRQISEADEMTKYLDEKV